MFFGFVKHVLSGFALITCLTRCSFDVFFFVNYSHLNHDRNMMFIKEETEDFRIEEVFSLKQEDFEELTGWFSFSMHLILIKMSA